MTDTDVKVNGRGAGETHRGSFSPFRYDISDMVGFGDEENILEVAVSKESSDPDMNGMLKADCFLDGIKKGMELKVAVSDKDGVVLAQYSYPLEGDCGRAEMKEDSTTTLSLISNAMKLKKIILTSRY